MHTTGCAFPRDFMKIMILIIITRPDDFCSTTDVPPPPVFPFRLAVND